MKKLIILLFALASLSSFAQSNLKWNVSVGGAFPLGSFAKMNYNLSTLATNCGLFDVDADCGDAATGFSLGVEALAPLQMEHLSFTFSADFHYNGLGALGKQYLNDVASYLDYTFRQELLSLGATSITSSCATDTRPTFYNIPLMIGLRYDVPLGTSMAIFAAAGVGANIRVITPIRFTERMNYMYGSYSDNMTMVMTYNYDTKGTIAFRAGGGLKFSEKLNLSAYYYYVGKGDVSATITTTSPDDATAQPNKQNLQLGNISPMMVVARVGYEF